MTDAVAIRETKNARSRVSGLIAAIVVFHPDPRQLLRLIDTIAVDVDRVVVFLNSHIAPELRMDLADRFQVDIIEAQCNLGIGVALNLVALSALWVGFGAIILFDQDSEPRPGTIARLREGQAALIADGHDPAVVAPLLVSPSDASSKPPTYRFRRSMARDAHLRATDFVPTSGSLISLDALRRVGFFRADYFIDGIDVEWCLRARALGLSCWVATDRPMVHRVGDGIIAWPVFRFRMPKQRAFRMYCMIRNTLYGLRLPHVPWRWRTRQMAYLPIQIVAYALHNRMERQVVRALGAGVVDGLLGRLGLPKCAPDGRWRPDRDGRGAG